MAAPRSGAICPSSSGASADARIIGYINPSGRVAPMVPPIAFTDAMRHSVGPHPERAFRLAAPCLGEGCVQWAGAQCSLIGRLRSELGPRPAAALPECGIRPACVWFRQDGADACGICPDVHYNPSAPEDPA